MRGFGFQIPLFASGLILLLSIWRHTDTASMLKEGSDELSAIVSCIKVLKIYEAGWHYAGRFWYAAYVSTFMEVAEEYHSDMLTALIASRGIVLPQSPSKPPAKQPSPPLNSHPSIASSRSTPGTTSSQSGEDSYSGLLDTPPSTDTLLQEISSTNVAYGVKSYNELIAQEAPQLYFALQSHINTMAQEQSQTPVYPQQQRLDQGFSQFLQPTFDGSHATGLSGMDTSFLASGVGVGPTTCGLLFVPFSPDFSLNFHQQPRSISHIPKASGTTRCSQRVCSQARPLEDTSECVPFE